MEGVRSCGDSLSTYLKVSWAVKLRQPEIKIHISVPEAQCLGVGKKLLGVDYIYLYSTSCPHCPEPLECTLILRSFAGTGWYQQCSLAPQPLQRGAPALGLSGALRLGNAPSFVFQGTQRITQGCRGAAGFTALKIIV